MDVVVDVVVSASAVTYPPLRAAVNATSFLM